MAPFIKTPPCFLQPKSSDTKVWRYMDIAKFINLLSTHELFFSRLDLLNDAHEGSITETSFLQRRLLNSTKNEEMEQKFNLQTGRFIFVNCWRIDDHESEAMWKLYCPNNNGIAIQSTYQKLLNIFPLDNKIHLGLINYINYKEADFPTGNIYFPVMHKRKAFEHEKEVRLAFSEMNNTEMRRSNQSPIGLGIKIEVEKLIDRVYVNPYAGSWYFSVIEELIKRFSLNILCKWSDISDKPKF